VAEVARGAEVSEATVFKYFPTKEDLLYWRLESFEQDLLETIRERAPGETLATEVRSRGKQALAFLEAGLGNYGAR
jgi:AcrR family transcriptional regulator